MKSGLRLHIELLERHGELKRVHASVSPDEEIAEITERIFRSGGEAIIFENVISDSEKNNSQFSTLNFQLSRFPVLTNIYGSQRRMALALGVERLEEISERIESLVSRVMKSDKTFADKLSMLPLAKQASRWLPKIKRGRGACQRYRLDNDLSLLPILKCHVGDGGAFLTLPMVCTADPETGARNVGMYRAQVLDNESLALHWHIHKTGARHFEKYRKRGERMPVAVCLGGRPSYAFTAMSPLPEGIDEWLFAGFLDNSSVKLVKCLTNDLRVPSDCDFVIEGYVDPSEELAWEGPFGDHTGFYSAADWYPRMHVTAITHCTGAIYPATIVGVPPQEDFYMAQAVERIFLTPMRLALQPELKDLWLPAMGVQHNLGVVNIDSRYRGNAEKVASSLWGAGQMMFNKYLLVTDTEGDIRDLELLSGLVRGADMRKCIFQSEGILDVLDHATDTPCYGGKVAIDLVGVEPIKPFPHPTQLEATGGIKHWNEWLVWQWGILIIRADRTQQIDVEAFIKKNRLEYLKAVVIMDEDTLGQQPSELLWLATANSDPRRDLSFVGDVVVLDARSREGYPDIVTASAEITKRVTQRWNEYWD